MKLLKSLLFIGAMLLPCFVHADDSVSGPGGTFVSQFLDEGVALTRRGKVNWTGAGVSCVDNSTLKRLDCTVTSSGSGSGTSTSLVIRYGGVLVSSPTGTINYLPPLIATLDGSTTAQISLSRISLSTGVVGSVDISTQTNLAVTAPLILTNDTLSISKISLSTGVAEPLLISSGSVTRVYVGTITFSDGSTQNTAASSASGDITAVNAGNGLIGGGLVGSVTLSADPSYSGFIHNTDALQSGSTAYPEFLNVGTSGAIIYGPVNISGMITASNTVLTNAAGLIDASKLFGTIPNSQLDETSVTKKGNTFNAANKLLLLDGSGLVPDANLSANVSLLGSSIDISAETNLAVQGPLILTDDTISIDSSTFVGGGGSMSPGASYYVNVDPLSVQSGAFNISSGTVQAFKIDDRRDPFDSGDAALVIQSSTSLVGRDMVVYENTRWNGSGSTDWSIKTYLHNRSDARYLAMNSLVRADDQTAGSEDSYYQVGVMRGGVESGVGFKLSGTDNTFELLSSGLKILLGSDSSAAIYENAAKLGLVINPRNSGTTGRHLTIGAGSSGVNYGLVFDGALSDGEISWENSGNFFSSSDTLKLFGGVVASTATFTSSMTLSGGIMVDSLTPTTGQVLKFDGTNWAPGTDSTGGGGGTTIWSKKDGANLDTAVSTINFLTGGGLTATSAPGGQINIGLSAGSTYFLGLGVAATTYATQANVTQSTTQLNSQFANYYSSGQSIGLFNLKTVDATTYATQANVIQSTTQLNSQFANYQTTGSALTTFILVSTGTNGVGQIVRLDGAGKLPAIDGSQLTNLPGGSGGGSWVGTATSTLNMAGYGIINVASISFVAPGGSYIDVGTNTFVGFVVNGTTWYVNQSSITFGGSAASLGSNILVSSFPATAVTAGSYTNTNLTVDAYGRITSASNGSGGSGGMYSFAISSNGVVVSSPAFNLSFTGPNLNVTVNGATNTVTYTSTVTTSGVPEGTNQYFTAARVNMALTNPTTIPFNVATSSVTPNPYGSGWNGSSRVVAEDAIYDKIESMSAGSGILATDTTTVSGSWTFLAPVEFRSTVTWTTTGGFDMQENSTLLIPRGMDTSTYTAKGSLAFDMTSLGVKVGTGTVNRFIGSEVKVTVFATTGTFTPDARMVSAKVILTGPGGSVATCAGTDSVSSGGGGGGTAIKTFTRAQIGASQAVGIPAGPAAGVVGSSSTFGSYLVAGPGDVGREGTAATVALSTVPARGGNATGGDVNLTGMPGAPGIIVTTAIGLGGNGGAAGYWNSGAGIGGYVDKNANPGSSPGGGAGGCHASSATDRTGAAGGGGYAYIEEYLGG